MLRAGGAKRPTGARNATLLTVIRPLVRFASRLPLITRNADDLTPAAMGVRDALLDTREPDRLIFEILPAALGMPPFVPGELVEPTRQEAFRRGLFGALRDLDAHYRNLLQQCRAAIHAAFGVPVDSLHLREDLRVRSSYLSGKVIEPRLRSFLGAALDETAGDQEWLVALVMVIADRPVDSWNKDEFLSFEMALSDLARRFMNLEALQKQAGVEAREGFEARRVTVTDASGDEIHRLIWIDRDQRAVIEAHAERLADQIRRAAAPEHQQHALLMALIEHLLYTPARQMPDAPALRRGDRKHG